MQLHLCKMTTFLAFRKTAHSLSSGRSGRRTDTTGDVMTDALTTISWDDFRLIKAIADARGLPGAAAQTGLNHSTVFRRLGQIETALGSALFERNRSGYAITPAGEEIVALRSEERRVGTECVSTSGSRWGRCN